MYYFALYNTIHLKLSFSFFHQNEATDDDVNQRIICDGCQMNPIKGLRFKCLDCPDFDLCEECYNKEIHKHHKMKRITQLGKLHYGDNCS